MRVTRRRVLRRIDGAGGPHQGGLAAAQGEMGHASKDAENPHFRSHYATLASVVDAVRAPLAKHGIAFLQGLEADGSVIRCTTRLAHASGEWIESTLTMAAQNASPQSLASATTVTTKLSGNAASNLVAATCSSPITSGTRTVFVPPETSTVTTVFGRAPNPAVGICNRI